jgi:ABC-2 type transport system ATP-binding protein
MRVIHDRVPAKEVIEESHTDKQRTLLVRTDEPIHDPSWTVTPVSMENLVLAYMSRARDDRARRLEVVS